MFAALALYAWPASFLPRGRLGWLGLAHFLGFGAAQPAPLRGWILATVVAALFIAGSFRSYPQPIAIGSKRHIAKTERRKNRAVEAILLIRRPTV
jgi:hypothetical protein